ncbi:TonB-dependent receptor [Phenylobacterium sp.]|uniref:TonB-dependent receptor domain-containing protein n=1 Tax=Phenylobacterium sp. TaxID=1871053 RepID=UPI001219449C|nr:TonB-dependent receptor [Phenylobacterium sp.]THD60463.1 MAG: TonB-dependent receptor [Phenylobacterium sp.]
MAKSGLWLAGLAVLGAPSAVLAQSEQPPQPPAAVAPAAATPAAGPPATSAPNAPATPAKPAPAKPAPKEKTVEEVTVTAAAPEEQVSIDKKSYTLGKDLMATTGSVGDALRNLPAVEVDPQGNLSLRGDQNVTILVDGKPSPMFEGAGRADALQQLPADQIERVEVITNPSAALNPEGTGGVINLITKKSRGGGVTGSAYFTATTAGLKRGGVNLGYNSSKLAVTASLSGNYQRNKQHTDDARGGLDEASGEFLKSDDQGIGRNLTRGPTARLSVTYTPEAKDQITGGVTYSELLVQGHPFDRFTDFDVDGAPDSILDRQGERRFLETDSSLTAGWTHTFGEGHELSVNGTYNESLGRDHRLYTSDSILPVETIPLELQRNDNSNHHEEVITSYTQKLAGGALKAGYELRRDDNDNNYLDEMGPAPSALVPQPGLANHYLYEQLVNSVYATYQHSFGALDVQGGLRGEDVNFTLDQLTSGQRNGQHYERAYPSLHLAYKLDDEKKLTASYSVRVQRPPSFFLNPLVLVDDPQDVQVGNPNLKVKEVQIYEVGYQQHVRNQDLQANFYFRNAHHDFADVETQIAGGVFETTFGNLGTSTAYGVDLSANGKITSTLSYSASLSPYVNHIAVAGLGVVTDSRSVGGVGGRVNLNWQVRPNDMIQFNAIQVGRHIATQGEYEPSFTLNMGWRHKINDRLTATLTGQDLLASNDFRQKINTVVLTQDLIVRPVFRAVFFRLDYRFGGGSAKAAKEPGFEYENGGAAPGPGGG